MGKCILASLLSHFFKVCIKIYSILVYSTRCVFWKICVIVFILILDLVYRGVFVVVYQVSKLKYECEGWGMKTDCDDSWMKDQNVNWSGLLKRFLYKEKNLIFSPEDKDVVSIITCTWLFLSHDVWDVYYVLKYNIKTMLLILYTCTVKKVWSMMEG